jgi:menaquinol-cytochrome c reductase iron-sulfur subunit
MNPEVEPKDAGTPGFSTPVGSRRNLFQWITGAAFKRRDKPWVEVGTVDDLPTGVPKQLDHVMTVRDGWLESKSHKAVWAVKQPGDQVRVYSPLCTHLGCGYHWDDADRKFKCPCHGSVFDVAGEVLGGPAPRRLDVLPTKIENGRVFVMYKEFKSGLADSVEL